MFISELLDNSCLRIIVVQIYMYVYIMCSIVYSCFSTCTNTYVHVCTVVCAVQMYVYNMYVRLTVLYVQLIFRDINLLQSLPQDSASLLQQASGTLASPSLCCHTSCASELQPAVHK